MPVVLPHFLVPPRLLLSKRLRRRVPQAVVWVVVWVVVWAAWVVACSNLNLCRLHLVFRPYNSLRICSSLRLASLHSSLHSHHVFILDFPKATLLYLD